MRDRTFVVVAHKFHATPDDDLVAYLNAMNASSVLHICHSFSDAPDRRSFFRLYRRGKLVREVHTRDYRSLPEPFIYLKELLFTVRWVVAERRRWDRYVALDGLCTLFGLMLRAFGRVHRVNFWNMDLVPRGRFPQRWKDEVYLRINRYSALHADEMWDITHLMVKEKERLLGLRRSGYRFHRVVPVGVWTDRIVRYRFGESDRHTLVFMGHLLEKQGVQLVLQAIPSIVQQVPDFRFKIIGSGSHEDDLRRLTKDLGVEPQVTFLGQLESTEMEDEIARSGAGIAPYIGDVDTYTKFGSDPGKIKIYLGCAVPVLVTDVPWIAREIEKRECGYILAASPEDIAAKVTRMLTDAEANQRCRDNAAAFSMEFDYRGIFESLSL
jgi:glycosyltransferase involved in cell wall biosynthesis